MSSTARQLAFPFGGLPARLEPMLPSVVHAPFDSSRWVFEARWGGLRCLAFVGDGRVSLKIRGGQDAAHRLPEVAQGILEAVSMDGVVLDGELVARDPFGKAQRSLVFERIQTGAPTPVAFHISDILYHGYRPVVGQTLARRKALLEATVASSDLVQPAYVQDALGTVFFEAAGMLGMEGIYAKRKGSLYHPGLRSQDWLHIIERRAARAIVVGYTVGPEPGQPFENLLLGAYDGDRLRYLGTVAGRFTPAARKLLHQRLAGALTSAPPIEDAPEVTSLLYWCEPRVVIEVEYGEAAPSGELRFPTFLVMCPDVSPVDCTFDDIPVPLKGPRTRRR